MIVCSTSAYGSIPAIKEYLESIDYEVTLPNCYDEPVTSEDNEKLSEEEYIEFFRRMYLESREKVSNIDSILVLNYDKVKKGEVFANYIGASTFLEMYEGFMQNKKIYLINDIPEYSMLYDDIKGMGPILLKGDIENIKKEF